MLLIPSVAIRYNMRGVKSEILPGRSRSNLTGCKRLRLSHFLLGLGALYTILFVCKLSFSIDIDSFIGGSGYSFGSYQPFDNNRTFERRLEANLTQSQKYNWKEKEHPISPVVPPVHDQQQQASYTPVMTMKMSYKDHQLSEFEKVVDAAWVAGAKAWEPAKNTDYNKINPTQMLEKKILPQECPSSMIVEGADFDEGGIMFLPCGLVAGSSITIVGASRKTHAAESEFIVEVQGYEAFNSNDPSNLLQLNPRLRGNLSHGRPIIEHNRGNKLKWIQAQRCDGIPSDSEDDTVEGLRRCEEWYRTNATETKKSTTSSWPFPFEEGKLFALTINAGLQGYHMHVDGRHISSFPYQMNFELENATILAINGSIDVLTVYATSLPISYLGFSNQEIQEMSEQRKPKSLPITKWVQLFIGIVSAANHFSARTAIRKTWMQHPALKNGSVVVARFFVALSSNKEVNVLLKREADYYGDVVILPFIDHYDLLVLKTIAICQYGVSKVSASYIMKCDDDTFVRVDSVLGEIKESSRNKSLYWAISISSQDHSEMVNGQLPLRSGRRKFTQHTPMVQHT